MLVAVSGTHVSLSLSASRSLDRFPCCAGKQQSFDSNRLTLPVVSLCNCCDDKPAKCPYTVESKFRLVKTRIEPVQECVDMCVKPNALTGSDANAHSTSVGHSIAVQPLTLDYRAAPHRFAAMLSCCVGHCIQKRSFRQIGIKRSEVTHTKPSIHAVVL